jgi:hypothetical protein
VRTSILAASFRPSIAGSESPSELLNTDTGWNRYLRLRPRAGQAGTATAHFFPLQFPNRWFYLALTRVECRTHHVDSVYQFKLILNNDYRNLIWSNLNNRYNEY